MTTQPGGTRTAPMTATTRQVLLLADTHGLVHPGILALAREVSVVVHAGDIGHPDVLARLAAEGRTLVAVRGNNDTAVRWPADRHAVLAGLERDADIELPGGRLAVEHGDRVNPVKQRHTMLRARHVGARLVVYGHSHRQVVDDGQSPWVVNPGAAGRSRTFGGSACMVLSAGVHSWRLTCYRFPLSDWNT